MATRRARARMAHPRRSYEIAGVPGTVEWNFSPHAIQEQPLPDVIVEHWLAAGLDPVKSGLRVFRMGACSILVAREDPRDTGEPLWHLSISCEHRHPSWDEIKIARYRLLPPELTFSMLLPPAHLYVNVPQQDHVFQLWEVNDPRAPWLG